MPDDKNPIGFAYAEAFSQGEKTLVGAFKSLLLKVKGFDYVPQDLRVRTFLQVADSLLKVHEEFNNFHREEPVARHLASLGSSVPTAALGKCFTAILACKIGNPYGIALSAQKHLDQILQTITPERWEYYFNSVLPGDETILFKLTHYDNPIENWIQLTDDYQLGRIESKKSKVNQLIQAGKEKNSGLIKKRAQALLNQIR